MNLSLTSKEVMALIHHGKSNIAHVGEEIDASVNKLIGDLQINDIANFVNDHSLHYRRFQA
jgi:hypothetical protein